MKDVNNKEPMKFDTLIFSFLQFGLPCWVVKKNASHKSHHPTIYRRQWKHTYEIFKTSALLYTEDLHRM